MGFFKKNPNWAKLCAFLSKMVGLYTDGWVVQQKIGIEKDFGGSADTSMYNFGASNPPLLD